MSDDVQYVFIYGTLKQGQPNHRFLTQPDLGTGCYFKSAETICCYPLVVATQWNLPCLLNVTGKGKVN